MPTIDVQGTPVHYQRTGTGPAVVLLHGGGLDDAGLSWSPLSPLLVGRALVIAPDLPGFGDSPLGATPPTVTGYAGWLAAFLDAVGLPRCVLGGLSLGSAVAIRSALDAPHRVTGVLGCAPYGIDPRVPGGRLGWLAVHSPGVAALGWWAMRHSRRAVVASLRPVMRSPVDDQLLEEVLPLLRRPEAGVAWRAFQRDEVRWSGPRGNPPFSGHDRSTATGNRGLQADEFHFLRRSESPCPISTLCSAILFWSSLRGGMTIGSFSPIGVLAR